MAGEEGQRSPKLAAGQTLNFPVQRQKKHLGACCHRRSTSFKERGAMRVKFEEAILTLSNIRVNIPLFSHNKDMLRDEKNRMLKVVKLLIKGRGL